MIVSIYNSLRLHEFGCIYHCLFDLKTWCFHWRDIIGWSLCSGIFTCCIASLVRLYSSGVLVGSVSLPWACFAAGASTGESAGLASEVGSAAGSTTTNRMIGQNQSHWKIYLQNYIMCTSSLTAWMKWQCVFQMSAGSNSSFIVMIEDQSFQRHSIGNTNFTGTWFFNHRRLMDSRF